MKKMILAIIVVLALLVFGCTAQVEKQPCGGIAGLKCPDGYRCQYENASISDNAGYCVPPSVKNY